MAETDGAWWAEVEHLREDIERRRAEASATSGFERVAAQPGGRFARGQSDAVTSERELVDAELAKLAAPRTRAREELPSEPISPAALLSLDVGWQEPVREEPVGEFTELIIPGQGVPGRPTVQIRGRGAEGRTDALLPERARRRPPRTVSERLGPRPDRVALYALLLAVVLIITAVATADASTL
jgi:hypothetical protein